MRKGLEKIEGVRGRFTATIAKLGKKNNLKGFPSDTVLFTSVKDESGTIVTDHIWFVIGKRMSCVYNNIGKTVSFEARVTEYEKGYKGYRTELSRPAERDYKLSNPTHVTIIEKK